MKVLSAVGVAISLLAAGQCDAQIYFPAPVTSYTPVTVARPVVAAPVVAIPQVTTPITVARHCANFAGGMISR